MERLDNSKLTPLQRHIVDEIASEQKVAIVGGPGTGKTVLAMSGMGLAGDKKQVLITYSKPLSLMIHGCNVRNCTTFHSFCWNLGAKIENILQDFSPEYEFDDDTKSQFRNVIMREYGFTKESPWQQIGKLIKAFNRLTDEQKKSLMYDDIFVDEAQDLPSEAFDLLKLLCKRMVVTYDEAQEVGGENENSTNKPVRKVGIECNAILRKLSLEDSFYDLIDNFRNTIAIERVAKLFYNNYGSNNLSLREVALGRPEGEKPKVLFTGLSQQLFDQIGDDCYQLNKQVGVIVPDLASYKQARDYLNISVQNGLLPKEKFFYKYGTEDNMNGSGDELNKTGVFLTTYQSSKGMEFDDVYILDCQKNLLQSPTDKNKFYVAVTRAKEKLTIVFSCDYRQSFPILNVIKQHEDLFDLEK